jgi:hypothetical protein
VVLIGFNFLRQKDTPINSLVTTVKAIVPNLNITIQYSFVYNGQLVNSVFEFQFRDQFSGQIYLTNSLNLAIGDKREVCVDLLQLYLQP